MTSQENTEPNLDDMSLEEIEAYQTQLRSGEVEEAQTIETEDNQEMEETVSGDSEMEAQFESKPEENNGVFLSPYLKDKSVDEAKSLIQRQLDYINSGKATASELEQIYLDNMRAASQVDSIRGDFKKKLKEQPEVKQNNQDDDILNGYDEESIRATEAIVSRVINQTQSNVIKQQEAIRESNYSYLNNLRQNDAIYKIVEPELTKEVQANPNIVFQPNWIESSSIRIINGALSASQTIPKVDNSKKKISATTIGSGGGSVPQSSSKSVEEMSADEYLAYMKSKGLIRVAS